jgi:hypothetical protein
MSLNILEFVSSIVVMLCGTQAPMNTPSVTLLPFAPEKPAPAVQPKPELSPVPLNDQGLLVLAEKPVEATPHLDLDQEVDRIAALISSNEGDPSSIDWNDNGQGVSVGMFQANQRVGDLPLLLQNMTEKEQGRHALLNAFGTELTGQIEQDPEIIREMEFSPDNWLGRGLLQLAETDSFRETQISMLRTRIVKVAGIAREHGLKSRLGLALCADLANQWGRRGCKKFLRAGLEEPNESLKVKAIVNAVDSETKYGARYLGDLEKASVLGLTAGDEFKADFLIAAHED